LNGSEAAVPEKDLSIVLCGAAGQGIKTVETLVVRTLKRSGYNVFASREYMSRVRGGSNSTEIRISSENVRAFVDRIDLLLALNGGIRKNIRDRISSNTVIVGDSEELGDEFSVLADQFYSIPLLEMAREAGGAVYSNVVAAGIVFGICGIPGSSVEGVFQEIFSKKGEKVVEKNLSAVTKGIAEGNRLRTDGTVNFGLRPDASVREDLLMDGSEAISLGAIAGGCNFIGSYPMSPATGVLTFLSENARSFGIVAEQVEDEIAAINMATGAGYAGARAMVSTSGGGFALMSEGLSLAAIMEVPVVIHLGQRPGPATGMATRTEQADLDLALYSGHGEFPRIVLAPATIEDGFWLTRKAFELADRFQTQVIVLSDQYFLNSFYNISPINVDGMQPPKTIVQSGEDYRRYEETPDGISPRSVPSFGTGLVGADSHEHDEWGHVQEDFELRVRMMNKRLRKLNGMEPVNSLFSGPEDPEDLVVSWGSTYPMVMEASRHLQAGSTSFMHIRQLWPFPSDLKDMLSGVRKLIVVEGNATGQLASLIRRETGISADYRILNYNGLQFSSESMLRELEKVLG
jgi:2-oxoglutarate ferredoxin oxidoreductase subunit alpha